MTQALSLASYVAYQVFFHPLRHHPGPLLAKLTGGYGAFYVWRKCFHLVTLRLHQEHGECLHLNFRPLLPGQSLLQPGHPH